VTGSMARAEELARQSLERVLATQWDQAPAVVVNSGPGAGKTGIVERVAALTLARLRERCMIATQTNEQAFDLARRLANRYTSFDTHLLTRDGLPIPPNVAALARLRIVHAPRQIPEGACVVIANAAKWSWIDVHEPMFDVQLVDEAFQLPDYKFQLIAGLARRYVHVGDPGQIDPLIRCELERWRSDPAGPHVPAPTALRQRHANLPVINLPVSRRLVADTVAFVQPAFYPGLPFEALGGQRSLRFGLPGLLPIDKPLDAAARGASMSFIELPACIVGEADEQLASVLVGAVRRLLERRALVANDGEPQPISAEMIGITCAHVSQVSAIRELMGRELDGVLVETANRFQGLERPIMFVYHPLSGRADANAFHLDAGRLCVMVSRHRVACFVLGREGITRQLLRYAPVGDRALRIAGDSEFRGWQAHLHLMEALTRAGRIYPIRPEDRVRRRA
jgi:hypothetical protein